MQTANDIRLWPLAEVMQRTSRRKSAIYADIAAGKFPRPVPLGGGKRRAWVSTEVEAWIAACIANRDARRTVAQD